jgi:D-arginine dehydrogenase
MVRALTAASGARFAELGRRFDLPPLLTPRPVLWLGLDPAGADQVRALIDECELRELSAGAAAEIAPALAPGAVVLAALDLTSQDVDAVALHQGYVRGLRARGGTVLAGAPVRALSRTGSGWRVDAGEQVLSCALVVDAAGAWADPVAGLAGVPRLGLVPKRRTLFVSPVSPGIPWDPRGPLVADVAERFYFKPEGPNVLASPADAQPCEPGDYHVDELAVAGAIEEINRVTRLGLRTVRRSWAGSRTFTADGAPVVGAWPEHPGFAFLAGLGGYGIQMSPALAALAAAALTGTPVPADILVDPAGLGPVRLC